MKRFKINPQLDLPIESAQLLGHEKIVQNLKDFIESEDMIAPLSIAIHGEWGTGKTSIMQTLQNTINNKKVDTIFFEAWKYEYSNPALALVTTISEKYASAEGDAKAIITAAAYILADKFLGVDIQKAIEIIRGGKTQADTLSVTLEKLIAKKLENKKLIIIIDDLDRCDVENTLQLLALMKLFLGIKNCICIAAVDFKRLEQAWIHKYGTDRASPNTGSQYLDKIFQIRIGISQPTTKMMREYLQTLTTDIPEELLDLFSRLGPTNPRSVKKMLNLISYRRSLLNSDYNDITASLWTLLEVILSNSTTTFLYELFKKVGNTLGGAIRTNGDNWPGLKSVIEQQIQGITGGPNDAKLELFFTKSNSLARKYELSAENLDADFEILYSTTKEIPG